MNSDLPRWDRLARFRKILSAALETEFYRPVLERAGLADRQSIGRVEVIDETLSRLSICGLPAILENFDILFNSAGCPPQPRELFYPLASHPRTAILAPGFRESRRLRMFDDASWRGLARWKPESLAGPAGVLRALALAVREGRIDLAPLTYPLIVFTGVEHGILHASDRDLLWEVFGVPLFEQLRGLGGELLAAECEAHHGLHVCSEDALVELALSASGDSEVVYTSLTSFQYPLLRLSTGFAVSLVDVPCGCGSQIPRLNVLRRHFPQRARAAASAAD